MCGVSAESWETGCTIARLPEEILALCFGWLPFRDRMTASHVSRLWRSISHTYPVVWEQIDVPWRRKDAPRLLRMALSRSAAHPVTITGSHGLDTEGIIARCLREHLHHVRKIDWQLPDDSLPLHEAAPVLESLSCLAYHIDIPADFLGGRRARLQTLHLSTVSLPQACPVLSTVTDLFLHGADEPAAAATYAMLFNLFPNLASLSLCDLEHAFAHTLPRGPAPSSLRHLVLYTGDGAYDLTPHFAAWRTDGLRAVELDQDAAPGHDILQLLEGAEDLRVIFNALRRTMRLVSRDAAGGTRAVSFEHADVRDVADMLSRAQHALHALVSLEIPLAALGPFESLLGALPHLARLAVRVSLVHTRENLQHRFPADLTLSIPRAMSACPALRELAIEVACPSAHCPLTLRDAHELAATVSQLRETGTPSPQLYIKGFAREVCAEMDSARRKGDSGFGVSFLCP